MHSHGHEHTRLRSDRRALAAALVLVAAFMVVEVVVGVLADSLAVLADAGHMLSDAASLTLALFAAWLAGRPPTPQRSFGYRRAEILAALATVSASSSSRSGSRGGFAPFSDPPEVAGGWVLVVGAIGLAVNLAAAGVLHRAEAIASTCAARCCTCSPTSGAPWG